MDVLLLCIVMSHCYVAGNIRQHNQESPLGPSFFSYNLQSANAELLLTSQARQHATTYWRLRARRRNPWARASISFTLRYVVAGNIRQQQKYSGFYHGIVKKGATYNPGFRYGFRRPWGFSPRASDAPVVVWPATAVWAYSLVTDGLIYFITSCLL